MSDNEASQTSNQTVPKERLDEVLGKARALEQQLQFTQAQVTHLLNGQKQQAPVAQDPEMERIKEENPVLYKKLVKQEQDLRQMRAGFFSMADEQDRFRFLNEFGEGGKRKLQEVEGLLEQERQRGNVQASRSSIYMYLRGQEKIKEETSPKSDPRPVAPTTQATQAEDAPSTNPSDATIKGGTAAPDYSNLSREDRLKKLENVVF